MVKVLLALGSGVNSTNSNNLTPLHFAVKLQGNEDSIAKTLIRWGATKVSMVLSNSSACNGADSLLAAAADALGHSELATMLENEAIGRHCKFQVDGVSKRGTIMKDDSIAHYQIRLDDTKESAIVMKHSVEISKPLLFDFRGIDRNVLFPASPPRQMDPPGGRRHVRFDTERLTSSGNNNSRQRLAQLIRGTDTASMSSRSLRRLHQRALETIQAMEHSQDVARDVLRIHQEISSVQGFESSDTSLAFIHHMQESIADRDDDIESLRGAIAMLRRRVENLHWRAEHGNFVSSRGQSRRESQDA